MIHPANIIILDNRLDHFAMRRREVSTMMMTDDKRNLDFGFEHFDR